MATLDRRLGCDRARKIARCCSEGKDVNGVQPKVCVRISFTFESIYQRFSSVQVHRIWPKRNTSRYSSFSFMQIVSPSSHHHSWIYFHFCGLPTDRRREKKHNNRSNFLLFSHTIKIIIETRERVCVLRNASEQEIHFIVCLAATCCSHYSVTPCE